MTLEGPWLTDPAARRLMALLGAAGHRALFVGGCVRNAALGMPVDDIDIATDALPARVTDLAEAKGFRVLPTGIEHGTVTVLGPRPLEVTTFRKDVETDGRRAVVAFSGDVAEDASRRDFTMNALYAEADGTLVDPLDGWPDLMARRVRFVGDARARIEEDYLRILRYFRFHAWYGDLSEGLDAEALAACGASADGLSRLSAERVGRETMKLMAAPDPAPSVAAMGQSGILSRILPGADAAHLAPLVHLEGILGVAPDPLRRLAAVGGDPDGLRLSRKEMRALETLRDAVSGGAGAAELAWRLGRDAARDAELLRAAAFAAPLPADLDARLDRGAAAVLPVTGADLTGRYAGREIGARLAELERRWIDSGFTLSRDDLLS